MILYSVYVSFPSDTNNDRRWEFQCASGGNLANVSSTCVLQVQQPGCQNLYLNNYTNNKHITDQPCFCSSVECSSCN